MIILELCVLFCSILVQFSDANENFNENKPVFYSESSITKLENEPTLIESAWTNGFANHHIVRRNSGLNYSKILDFWNIHRNDFQMNQTYDKLVLVVGNTGSGKSTLITGLIGDNLNAIDVYGEFMIVDGKKRIGTDSQSRTLIPELIHDNKTGVTYVDLPGFNDNRDTEYGVSILYYEDLLVKHLKSIKMIVTLNFESIKTSGNKNDFDDLLNHLIRFMPNITKLQNGITLVITKVENQNRTIEETNKILRGIETFLNEKKNEYDTKENDRELNELKAKLVGYFLEKQNDNILKRVTIFRKPNREGSLKDLIKDEMDDVFRINENQQYIPVTKNDFGYVVSDSLLNELTHIISTIFQNSLFIHHQDLIKEIIAYYQKYEEQHNQIRAASRRLLKAERDFSNIDESSLSAFFQNIFNTTNDLKLNVSQSIQQSIENSIQSMDFFIKLSSHHMQTELDTLENEWQKLIKFIRNARYWNLFLIHIEYKLLKYDKQDPEIINQIRNVSTTIKHLTHTYIRDIDGFEMFSKAIDSDFDYKGLEGIQIDENQLKKLWIILDNYSRKPQYTCSSSQMTVKGFNIKMSDVVDDLCWSNATDIQIYAENKIFIDTDINKDGIRLSICAHTWDNFGWHTIKLSGKDGTLHKPLTESNGMIGKPGLPGGSGGHFIGIGQHFKNAHFLTIEANGGNGESGQNGAKGYNGINGTEFIKRYTRTTYSIEDFKILLNNQNLTFSLNQTSQNETIRSASDASDSVNNNPSYHLLRTDHNLTIFGKMAILPGDGGDGGASGLTGFAGSIQLVGFENKPSWQSIDGKLNGSIGLGGYGGKPAFNGRNASCHFFTRTLVFDNTDSLNVTTKPIIYNSRPICSWTPYTVTLPGRKGQNGTNVADRRMPQNIMSSDLRAIINSFKEYVEVNLANNTKEIELKRFIDIL